MSTEIWLLFIVREAVVIERTQAAIFDPVVKTTTRIYLEESVNPSLCTIFSDSFSICPKDSGKKRLARTSNEKLQYVATLSAL
jgi:hypothetical protein